MKTVINILTILILLSSCNKEEAKHPLLDYLEISHHNPNEYVVKKFKSHDVIFIGENHYIKEQVEFVKNLIPDLYQNGIYTLGTEFVNYEDSDLANKLITDEVFDNELAELISFKSTWHWGYKEYIDIYREAWKLNKSLSKDARKFKIFGIQEVVDFSFVKKEEDLNNPKIMEKVFAGSLEFDEEEGYSANTIQKEVLNFGEKALIHCGIHHGFTSYYQPFFSKKEGFLGRFQKERVGNLIKNKIGDKAITIFIHGPWPSKEGYSYRRLPVDGILDSIFSIEKNRAYYPFGVDTKSTVFGDLKSENSVYKYGYNNFSLKDFCDGYIFLKPINQYESVTAIPNFIKPEQVEYVKSQELDLRSHNLTAKDLNDSIKIWLIKDQKENNKIQ